MVWGSELSRWIDHPFRILRVKRSKSHARLRRRLRAVGLHVRRLRSRGAAFARRSTSRVTSARKTGRRQSSIRRTIRRLVVIVRWQWERFGSRFLSRFSTTTRLPIPVQGTQHSVNRCVNTTPDHEHRSKELRFPRTAAIVVLLRRQTVWSIAATTGTVVVILMLILQLSPMLAAPRTKPRMQSDERTVPPSTDAAAITRPPTTEDDPFAETSDAETPAPNRNTPSVSVQPAPRLDVTLLRLTPHDPRDTQDVETEFRVSATTRADRRTSIDSANQKTADADWRRSVDKHRRDLTRPLLTRGNRSDISDNRGDATGREPVVVSAAPAVTKIGAPKLEFRVTAPERLVVGDRCPIVFRMTNSGDVPARSVQVRIQLPPALTYPKGASLEYVVGTIPAGQSREAHLTPSATVVGQVSFTVDWESAGRVVEHSLKTVRIAAPNRPRPAQSPASHRPEAVHDAPCRCPLPPLQEVR